MEFIPVPLRNLGSSLGKLGLETSPDILLIRFVLGLAQPDGFFRRKLRHTGEVLYAKAIQYLGALQLALAKAEGTLDGFGSY